MFEWLLKLLGNTIASLLNTMFQDAILKVGYSTFMIGYIPLVLIPLILIGFIVAAFKIVAIGLPQYLLFGIDLNGKFSFENLPSMFKRLTVVALLVFVVLFLFSAVRLHFYNELKEQNPIKIALKNSVFATVWILALPISIYLLNILVSLLLNLVLAKQEFNTSALIFNTLYDKNALTTHISAENWTLFQNNNYQIPISGYASLPDGEAIKLVFLGGLIAIPSFVILLKGLLTLVQKTFQLFFLFIIAPFVASSAIGDDANKLKRWQRMFLTKTLVITAFLLGFEIYFSFANLSYTWINKSYSNDFWLRYALAWGLIVGGLKATTMLNAEVALLLNEHSKIKSTIFETKTVFSNAWSMGFKHWNDDQDNFSIQSQTKINASDENSKTNKWTARFNRNNLKTFRQPLSLANNSVIKQFVNTENQKVISNVNRYQLLVERLKNNSPQTKQIINLKQITKTNQTTNYANENKESAAKFVELMNRQKDLNTLLQNKISSKKEFKKKEAHESREAEKTFAHIFAKNINQAKIVQKTLEKLQHKTLQNNSKDSSTVLKE
ncbi:Mbov_0396 family ICE element transmembrane protein [Mycoplasmopsis columbinasalis]|uniref:Uncharacterized protein n=1 Tax=Mycoplasmopsis columbinasalis TaxID=114880 RepID=A0A449BAL6_9BACT|nr:hypothetical protein [Mycoplasmopsis columbinasalis]VEU78252.1 Uncharacterised protein [Mycoplasmopsis columbinasalis]